MSRSPASYVAATRRIRPEFIFEKHYRKLFESGARRLADGHKLPVEFFVTFTTERASEAVSVGGKTWIIFDQGLSQTFTELNRLWTMNAPAAEVREFGLRYMAEYAQITGRLELALVLAVMADEADRAIGEDRIASDHHLRGRLTHVQERYILYHEVCHAILAGKPRKAETIQAARLSFIHEFLVEELRSLAANVEKGTVPEEVAQVQLATVGRWLSTHWRDDALVEECACDSIALPAIYEEVRNFPGLPAWQFVVAVLFASRHQMTLASLRNILDRSDPSRRNSADPMDALNIRWNFVRWELSKDYRKGLFGSDFDFDSCLNSHSFEYEITIDLPIKALDVEVAALERNLWFPTTDAERAANLHSRIDDLLGSKETKAYAAEMGEEVFVYAPRDTDAFNRAMSLKDKIRKMFSGK